MCTPLTIIEFTMINYLMIDIPLEHTLEEFGQEMLRRVNDTLNFYDSGFPCKEERTPEIPMPAPKFATPYTNMIMPHMGLWNELMISAVQGPSILEKKFALDAPRLLNEDNIFAKWYMFMPEWCALDSQHNMIKLNVDSMEIPERWQEILQREPKIDLLRQMDAKVAECTSDTNSAISGQRYLSSTVNMWTIQEAFMARKRDNKHILCHRHRNMHYTFKVTPAKGRKCRKNYFRKFAMSANNGCAPVSDSGTE